jgi:hypothetical protein
MNEKTLENQTAGQATCLGAKKEPPPEKTILYN